MTMFTIFADISSQAKVMLAAIPESAALLVFGVSLIVLTIGLRWMFSRQDQIKIEVKNKEAGK